MEFEGRNVWIIGASAGIGAALALELDRAGARCVLSARRESRLRDVRSACRHPDRHHVLRLDVSDLQSHRKAAEEADALLEGGLDIVVLNAGIGQRGLALESEFDVLERIIQVNLTGIMSLTHAAGRLMTEHRRGYFIAISSVLGRIAIPGSSAYSASKFGLIGFFEAIRGEVAPHGIGVSIVCPGYINTELTLHALQSDGTPFGIIDENHTYGMDPDVCARKIRAGVEKEKPMFLVGGKETWGVRLARFFPGTVRKLTQRYTRK